MINNLIAPITSKVSPKTARIIVILAATAMFVLSSGAPDAFGGFGG